MVDKKILTSGMILLISIFLISIVSSQNVSYCCEKTTSGAWCQDAPEAKCDDNFRKVPTSCEATSYCKKSCCFNSQEGTCMENSPQRNCQELGGVWDETYSADCDIPQCSLGCCLIGDQAAFVTQTRCKRLSSLYGLEINFRTDISNEIQCILSATSDVKGACVFEKEFEKTCLFLTKKECLEMEINSGTEVSFHEGFLCSAESLGTNCGPTEQTKCVEGRDEVYFIDSCGNLANIYDASRIEDKNYWSKIIGKDESCGADDTNGNADSETCGNCDYYLGSTCKTKSARDAKPKFGDYICRDLSCEYEGKKYEHGETWCADAKGVKDNLPGSRHFRLVCYNGEVSVEPCADFRQEVCIQSDIDGFKTAACRVNMWQDCYAQTNKKDCENEDARDCKWIQTIWSPRAGDTPGIIRSSGGVCVPLHTPGLDFWEAEGDAQSLCSIASTKCVVLWEEGLIGGSDCIANCQCLSPTWKSQMSKICTLIGDCGDSKNYIGGSGY